MDANIQKPTPVERAQKQLDEAVARLEAALKAHTPAGPPAAELAAMRTQNAALKDVTATVSARLDGAINRIRAVLER